MLDPGQAQQVAHYRLIEQIGEGGMGEIYKALDLRLNRSVALKFITQSTDDNVHQRLLGEAQAAAALNHPRIAMVYELGQSDGFSFIAMEYVEGESIAEVIARGPLPIDKALDIAMQIGEALDAAHARGIVHCDIKGANVILTGDGNVKVCDFGLARISSASTRQPSDNGSANAAIMSASSFESTMVAGTASYMSPEQARGLAVDARTDLFSLGVLLYEMVTGRKPFTGDRPSAILHAIFNDEAPPLGTSLSDAPLELERLIRKALEKDRERRYQSAREMLADLGNLKRHLATASDVEPLMAEPSASGAAFRGLLPFQEADRHRFFGREAETDALFEMVAHSDFRFGVLFGESGSGKTSLLKASVLPRLREAGFVLITCRSYKDPVAALIDECRRQSGLTINDGESVPDYLKRVCRELCAPLIVVCDQFEEFFVNHKTRREREPFVALVGACYNDERLAIKFLFSLRSDFLYAISVEFGERVPEPLMSTRLFHLHNFDEPQAAEIIDRSARVAGLPFEPDLSQIVARDLASADMVLPSELQIIGERLQTRRIYTAQGYRRAGGKEPLVYTFLEDVIEATGDQDGARLLLRALISDESTRLTLTIDEIARRTQRRRAAVERLLNLFVSARLVREIQEDDPWRYELMHEYLIARINQITGRVMDARQRANRLFRQYLANYTVDRHTRIPLSKLWFIRRYSDIQRGNRERELLQRSLRLGLIKASVLSLVLLVATVVAAATFSISEEWESTRLSDGHTAAVRQAVFSPDGKRLVSCSEDRQVIVWDFARRERLATLTDHEDLVVAVAFSPDGKWFASASRDGTVIVWDAASIQKAFVLSTQHIGITRIAFSPDGQYLVAVGAQGIAWRVGAFEQVIELKKTGGSDFAFLPHSRTIVCPLNLNELTFIDLATGKRETYAIASTIQGASAISPDGRSKLTTDGDGSVQFLDLMQHKVIDTFAAHKDNGRSVAFSPDGQLAASASEFVILWDVRTRTKIATLEHESLVWNVSFSPDGRWLASTHADGAILIWNIAERRRVANLNEHSAAVYGVAYSADGQRIASASEDSSVIVWNAASGRKEAALVGHNSKVNGVAFLPDGQHLVSCGFQDEPRLWDIARGAVVHRFTIPDPAEHGNNGFAVSPDGRWLATSHGIHDIWEGRVLCYFPDKRKNDRPDDDWLWESSQIYGMAFSRDGRWLACSTVITGHLGLLDTNNWELTVQTRVEGTPFISLSFSPDGKLLASGDDEGKVELWNVNPLERIAVMGRHAARVKAVAFSPDGKQVVSSSDDKTIALWNVSSRSLATRIGTHAAPVRAVAFSPDGRQIVSGEHDKSVRLHTRHRVLWGNRLD